MGALVLELLEDTDGVVVEGAASAADTVGREEMCTMAVGDSLVVGEAAGFALSGEVCALAEPFEKEDDCIRPLAAATVTQSETKRIKMRTTMASRRRRSCRLRGAKQISICSNLTETVESYSSGGSSSCSLGAKRKCR